MHKRFHWFYIFVLILICGCATAPITPPSGIGYEKKIYLKDLCDRNNIFLSLDSLTQVITLRKNNISARGFVGSDIFYFDDYEIRLSRPVELEKSSLVVPHDFIAKIIDKFNVAIEEKGDYSFRKIKEVVIDPGHGGKDPGAIGRMGTKEKEIVLDIALRLKKILEDKGITVKMTRSNDVFVSLQRRTEIASSPEADLFISVHANANRVRSINGVEVYALKNLSVFEKNEQQRLINHKRMFNKYSMTKNNENVERIISDMLYVYKQNESDVLSSSIAKETSKFAKSKNLGSKKSKFFVLRNTLIPAVLAEVGFLSNPKEERLLRTKEYRQKIAHGLAQGILNYAQNIE